MIVKNNIDIEKSVLMTDVLKVISTLINALCLIL